MICFQVSPFSQANPSSHLYRWLPREFLDHPSVNYLGAITVQTGRAPVCYRTAPTIPQNISDFKSCSSCHTIDHSFIKTTFFTVLWGVYSIVYCLLLMEVLEFVHSFCQCFCSLLSHTFLFTFCFKLINTWGGTGTNYSQSSACGWSLCTPHLLPRQKFTFLALMREENREEEQEETSTWD